MKFSKITVRIDTLRQKCENPVETHDWKKRLENMKKVQEISMIYLQIIEGSS